jgi:hypothetical protein
VKNCLTRQAADNCERKKKKNQAGDQRENKVINMENRVRNIKQEKAGLPKPSASSKFFSSP